MKTIPTAEEFLIDNASNPNKGWSEKKRLIEFAKLHVEAALDRAYHNQGMSWTNSKDEEVKKELFIKNSYPLSKII